MKATGLGCIIMIGLLVGVITLGACCVNYITNVCWGVDLPIWADFCIGILAPICVTVAIICFIVEKCDVPTPFFNQPTE